MVCFLERPLRLADLLGLAVCHRGQAGLAEEAGCVGPGTSHLSPWRICTYEQGGHVLRGHGPLVHSGNTYEACYQRRQDKRARLPYPSCPVHLPVHLQDPDLPSDPQAFRTQKKWLILWLVANWLPLLIIGLGKKYQPKKERIKEELWEAGEKAAGIPGAASAPVILSDEGLSAHLRERTVKDFGKKRCLLKDISLNIPPNSLVLLLGGSGAGKTTLINALIGYEQADATVLLNGVNVYKEYDRVKHKIGFVPQQNLIRGKDTVIRTVSDAAEMRLPTSISTEQRKQLIKEDMDLLGLSAGQDGLVSKKSGGQLRRICIAMELVTDPVLFVLDEPDSGLDGVISREIFTKLRRIADDGRIVIVITHTPDRVIDLFDKVIVLARDSGRVGRLAFYGSPQEAREFFGKDSMEKIVMSVNSKDEGGEGRADEFIGKYAAYAAQRDSAAGAAIEKDTADAASGKGGQES